MVSAGMLGYHAAKHGVVGLMRVYAKAYARYSIRVNTVHPTGVNTPMVINDPFIEWVLSDPTIGENLENPLPIPMLDPEDVAEAVAWLCSPAARAVTGVTMPVDAGFTL
jgi:NAD(P)-dependent dehydrogenase (short-subunit alcohol dehydrogenase family)